MAPHSTAVKLPSRAAAPPGMGSHRFSRAIAKGPPRKIRIVHVVEPTVIKTDVGQFRELVQRLTGKPPDGVGVGGEGASSSSAQSAAAESSSEAATGSSPDRAGAAPASEAVKAEEITEEEVAASPFARGLEEVGDANQGDPMETVKAEVKEEKDAAASPEDDGLGEVLGEEYDAFFHGLDDFLLSAYQADGFCL